MELPHHRRQDEIIMISKKWRIFVSYAKFGGSVTYLPRVDQSKAFPHHGVVIMTKFNELPNELELSYDLPELEFNEIPIVRSQRASGC
jgi:hypothetical protein